MNRLKIVIAALLAVITCLSVFAGCQNNPEETKPASTTKSDETDTVEVTETEPEETYYIPTAKFGGDVFRVLCPGVSDNEWECKDFFAEEDSDDPVASAVYQRMTLLEDKFGIKFELVDNASRSSIGSLVKKDITSGDKEYDLVMQVISNAYTLAQSGYLMNLDSIPCLDLKSDVWDQSYLEQSSIGGINYFATGEITTMDNDATWVMMFNKKLV